jgi:hypothetical protein
VAGRVERLRERLENSNYILLKIPIEIHLFERGLQGICMHFRCLPGILGRSESVLEHLWQEGLVHITPPAPRSKNRIDHTALQQTYVQMLAEGAFHGQAELDRRLREQQSVGEQGVEGHPLRSRLTPMGKD